ncbi:MAG: peptide ABC transporter substrate-binding protein [Elainellaceae cyanobacterium]
MIAPSFFRRYKRPLTYAGILLCLLGTPACFRQGDSSSESQSESAAGETGDTNTTLRLLYWQAPTILNPHLSTGFKDAEASRISLEPLASYDKDGNMILFLAAEEPTLENGGISSDGRSVTWTLKQNVMWSDGTPFTAADVVFTYEFLTNPDSGATSAGTYEIIESVEALDEHTVQVNFKEVNPAWFLVFMGTEGMILPKHMYDEYVGASSREAPANLMPVGTGPYRVTEFRPGDTVVYEPNPNFREAEKPFFQRVELKGGGDATSAARAVLQTGDADFAYNLQVEAQVLSQLTGSGQVVSNFGSLMERILINQTDPNRETADGERSSLQFPHPFFSDPQVRQALSLAIDREAIAQQLYGPSGRATSNFVVAPDQYVSPNTSHAFDLEKAADLLDQAGWVDSNGNDIRDKNGTEMQIVFQTSVNPVRQKTQEIVKQSLESIGMAVELKSIDASIFFSGDPGNTDTTERFLADLQMFTTGNTSPDPGAYLQTYTCDQIPQKSNNWVGDNTSRYCNEDYDALWAQSAKELDPEVRQGMILDMNDMLVNDGVVIPLVHRAETAGVGNDLTGVDLTPWDVNTWNIMDWTRQ